MHTIKYKKCVAQQDNKTLEVVVSKDGYGNISYQPEKKLSVKELRTIINRYLEELKSKGE